jgi:hypothetical protein
MAIGAVRTNGSIPTSGSFQYGYQPLLLKIAGTGIATADTGGKDPSTDRSSPIVEGTRTKAVRAIATLGQILAVDTGSATTAVTVLVDDATFNKGAGATTAGAYGALKDAIAAATNVAVGDQTVTTSSAFTSAGVWTLA